MWQKMNKTLCILFFFALASCARYLPVKDTPPINNSITQEEEKIEPEQEPEWLIIGGNKVYKFRPRQYEHYLKSEAENITGVMLRVNPKNETHPVNIELIATSLEGIEQLVNLQSLRIVGWSIDELDFSPLIPLRGLNHITFSSGANAKLTKIPDLRWIASRESITSIEFEDCALTNFDNIEFLPNLQEIIVARNFGDFTSINALYSLQHIEVLEINGTENSIYHIEEIGIKPNLKKLKLYGKQVDVKGIEILNSLENIDLSECDVLNTWYLSGLKNLKYFEMMIREPEPNIQFLEGMISLKYLALFAGDGTWGRQTVEKYQILDLGPIGKLSQLTYLELRGFILQNLAALDKLDNLENTYFLNSVLKDSSEISSKEITFDPEAPGFRPVWGINE